MSLSVSTQCRCYYSLDICSRRHRNLTKGVLISHREAIKLSLKPEQCCQVKICIVLPIWVQFELCTVHSALNRIQFQDIKTLLTPVTQKKGLYILIDPLMMNNN